jgi:TRAP-type mannitol/chloroaromatic compound transport system permease small subunit
LGKPRRGGVRFFGNDRGDQRTIGRHGLVDALALDLKRPIPVKVVAILAAGGGRDLGRRPVRRGERGLGVRALLKLSGVIDAINTQIGRWVSWLILLAVVVSAGNAIIRKVFDLSSNSWLELQWILFSAVFLLCASWTLLNNEHIRIDIVNNQLPRRLRNAIELVGHTFFLLPLCIIMIVTGVPFFLTSVEINEQSGNSGGLPQWPAKSLVMIGFALLLAQAVSELIKRVAIMRGVIPDPHETQVHALVAEVEHIVEAIEKH